jgi:hypothetical protein
MRFLYCSIILVLAAFCQLQASGQVFVRKTDTMNTDSKHFTLQKSHWTNTKEVSLNFTSLLHNFVPFNLGESRPGVTSIRTKWYGAGKYALRTSLGFDGQFNERQPLLYFAIGYEQRRILTRRLSYTSGWDVFIGNNLRNRPPTTFNNSLVAGGVTRHYALEWHFNSRMYMSTDAQVLVGPIGGAAIGIIYPTAIYFNVRL